MSTHLEVTVKSGKKKLHSFYTTYKILAVRDMIKDERIFEEFTVYGDGKPKWVINSSELGLIINVLELRYGNKKAERKNQSDESYTDEDYDKDLIDGLHAIRGAAYQISDSMPFTITLQIV